MLNIAIVSGPENGSPKVLADTLHTLIAQTEHRSEVFREAKAFRRLLDARSAGKNVLMWAAYRLLNAFSDRKLFRKLKTMDAIVLCDWTPHGFYKDSYNIPRLRKKTGIPVLYYAVQYLENSPTIIERLTSGGHDLRERYDWHLSVSDITELRGKVQAPWTRIGINLKGTGLGPVRKEKFLAVVDFLRPGYEHYRQEQIAALERQDIPYISLEGSYELEEIRAIYKQASVLFIQFPEAYGLPIAECLAYGCYIATPDSSWAMSWRLDEKVEVHGPGTLADCFLQYDETKDLESKLAELRDEFDPEGSPQKVFSSFTKNYGVFYEGDLDALTEVLQKIEKGDI